MMKFWSESGSKIEKLRAEVWALKQDVSCLLVLKEGKKMAEPLRKKIAELEAEIALEEQS
jgi:hypothetical protein